MKKRGFTLIEMLIVIVIIGILAVALIPRIGNARDRAADVARMADARSIATAIISFRLDNGRLPTDLDELVSDDADYGLGGAVPTDPDSGEKYKYANIDGRHFMVCATLSSNTAGNSSSNYCDPDTTIAITASIKKNGLLARFVPQVHAEKDYGECCELDENYIQYRQNAIIDYWEYQKGVLLLNCYTKDTFYRPSKYPHLWEDGDLLCLGSDNYGDNVLQEDDGNEIYFYRIENHDPKLYNLYKEAFDNCTKLCIKDCKGDQSCIENKCFNNGEKCKDYYKDYDKYLKNKEYEDVDWYQKYNEYVDELDELDACIEYHNNGGCDDGGNGGNGGNGGDGGDDGGNGGNGSSNTKYTYMQYVKAIGKDKKGPYYIYIN